MTVQDILSAIDETLNSLRHARAILSGHGIGERGGKSAAIQPAKAKKRTLSADGRARIAAAQRKRWAALKNTAKKTI
jgi:hypothetical protein